MEDNGRANTRDDEAVSSAECLSEVSDDTSVIAFLKSQVLFNKEVMIAVTNVKMMTEKTLKIEVEGLLAADVSIFNYVLQMQNYVRDLEKKVTELQKRDKACERSPDC